MITKFTTILEQSINNNQHDDILLIVDVQIFFNKFIPQGYVDKLTNYCNDFKIVYQIWDSNNGILKPSYSFPNEKLTVEKKFGKNFLNKNVKSWMEKNLNLEEGKKTKIKGREEWIVRVKNNHGWFYVNENLTKLFLNLKGKNIIIVGGADNECLEDVYIAAKSFGVNPIYNHEFIYSAETTNKQKVNDINNTK